MPKPAMAWPTAVPTPAATPPRFIHVDSKCRGAHAVVHKLPQTICWDSVQPCMNFDKNIQYLELTKPNCRENNALKSSPIVNNNFVGQRCNARPHNGEATTCPILSKEPKRLNSTCVMPGFAAWMAGSDAGVAPPLYDMKAWTPKENAAKTKTLAPKLPVTSSRISAKPSSVKSNCDRLKPSGTSSVLPPTLMSSWKLPEAARATAPRMWMPVKLVRLLPRWRAILGPVRSVLESPEELRCICILDLAARRSDSAAASLHTKETC
mmetsp:Transcript_4583/g.12998  ORF Transcript_4583/g.12998 Transcript_4583/m.12998 type:complete len:265 (-) Transcript_4583:72-866(-)